MPEIKKVFLRGKMNKDLDERLLPDGEYRDASNIQISSTESSDAGTVQNILGNEKIPLDASAETKLYLNFGDGTKCVGAIADDVEEIIYIFLKGDGVNGIVEYNVTSKKIIPLIIDSRGDKILDFSGNKITGISILEGFLFFTDYPIKEPKGININPITSADPSPFKKYYQYPADTSNQNDFANTTQINGASFKLEDITVITKKPIQAPGIKIDKQATATNEKTLFEEKFVRFAYRWKFKNNQYSVISPFSEVAFEPKVTAAYDLDEGYNERMVNNISKIQLYNFDLSANNIESVDILYKETNNTNVYIYKTITNPSPTLTVDIEKESVYSVIPEKELLRVYDNVPFKAKALDVVGNRLVFGNYIDGINLDSVSDYNEHPDTGVVTITETVDYEPNFNVGQTTGTTRFVSRDSTQIPAITGSNNSDKRTIKSGRNYQLGIVFEDEFGRQTPIVSNDTGLIKRNYGITGGYDDANVSKQLEVQMAGNPPSDPRIAHFKIYIKDNSAEYYNFIAERVYDDTSNDDHGWISIPSYEINKIKEDSTLVLKKAATGGAITTPANTVVSKYKVLDISESKPETVNTNDSVDGRFFVKVKKDSQLTNETISQGGITSSSLITDGDSNWVSGSEGGIFLGQYDRPDGDPNNPSRYERTRFYYNNGNIVEVVDTTGYSVANDFTHSTSAYNQSNSTDASLPGSVGSNWKNLNKSGSDSSGAVSKVFVRNLADSSSSGFNDYPYEFYIVLSSTTTPSNPSGTGPAVFETVPDENILDIYYETEETYPITEYNNPHALKWYNAINFGDGVESNRFKDDFNEVFIDPQVRVSTSVEDYTERNNESGLIYSGLFNANNSVNNLNVFNTGVKITKNLNTEYGSIQKLYTRNTDLIAFCEEKVLKVLANKDALFNADGNVNLVSTNNVLGQAVAFAGEYGISQNPESFAEHNGRIYFSDKSNGAVLRLSRDGLTAISDKGMKGFFREKLSKEIGDIIGSYDIYSDQYILSLGIEGDSISFKEDVDGWVSRLTFLPEVGVSIEGNYYTFFDGQLYLHHKEGERNVFYGRAESSGIQLIFNQEASAIKNFKNISYEGTTGWETNSRGITTDQQEGEVIEFKEKEGKYFGLISGIETQLDSISPEELNTRLKDFSIQGLGNISSTAGILEFTCANAGFAIANSNTTTADGTPITALSQSSVTAGTLVSVIVGSSPNIQLGSTDYTATITVPSGYSNTGQTIPCIATATGTAINPTFDCTTANFQVTAGTVGNATAGTVSVGTIASGTISPSTYQSGSTVYTATINIPGSGYSNSGTIPCTDTLTAAEASCAFSLGVTTYSSGGTTLSGTFTGSNIGTNPTINLTTTHAGGVSPTSTTKSVLAGSGVTVTAAEQAVITATISGGLCDGESASISMPQASTVAISGSGSAFTHDSILLTANGTGINSYQWHKSSTSGFTPSSSTEILNATGQQFDAESSATGTFYYICRVNDATNSAQHPVAYSNRNQITGLKFKSGSTADVNACTETTTKNVFVKPANGTLLTATEFFSDVQGNKSNLQGTYSDGSKYRFVSSTGLPDPAVNCGTGGSGGDGNGGSTATTQRIKVKDCRNLLSDKVIEVTLGTGQSTLSVGNVISFTNNITIGSTTYQYFHVTNAGTTAAVDYTKTLSSTHTSCLAVDPPTIDLTGDVIVFAGADIDLNAQPQFTPQGASFTYVYKKSTDGGANYSTLQTTTNANITDTAPTTAQTIKYTVGIQGTSIISAPPKEVSILLYYQHDLKYANTSSNSDTACTSSSEQTVFANINYISGAITQLYKTSAGSTSGFAAGTYSDGSIHGYFNASGVLQGNWAQCPNPAGTIEIQYNGSGSDVTGVNPFGTVYLQFQNNGITNITGYSWTKQSVQVATTSDHGAVLTSTERNATTSGVTTTKRYGLTVQGTGPDGNTGSFTDIIDISWTGAHQLVEVRPCLGSNILRQAKITNSSGWPPNTVLNLTGGGSIIPDGCWLITNVSPSWSDGQQDTSVQVVMDDPDAISPFNYSADCCACSSCTVAISGNTTGTTGTNVALQVASSDIVGFNVNTSGNQYKWYRRESTSAAWVELTSNANQSSIQVNENVAAPMYYKVAVYGSNRSTASVVKEDEHTITWSTPAQPVARTYGVKVLSSNCDGSTTGTTSYVNHTSISALSVGMVLTKGGDTTNCWSVTDNAVTYTTGNPGIIIQPSCTQCYNLLNQDCSMTMSAGSVYNVANGTAVFTAAIGSSAAATDTISLVATDSSTVSPTSTTVSALEAGLTVTIGQGKTLKATLTSGTCSTLSPPTSATAVSPTSNCNLVTLYYTTANPATSSSAMSDLCGNGNTRNFRLNSASLANATQLYSGTLDCTTLESNTKYFSQSFSGYSPTVYYRWNGSSFSNAISLSCNSGGGGNIQ